MRGVSLPQLSPASMSAQQLSCADELGPGIENGRCTLSGFIHLNKLFIERNRPDSSWLVLRRFGYESACDHLLGVRLDPELTHKSLPAKSYPSDGTSSDSKTASNNFDPNQNRVPMLKAGKSDQAFELSGSAVKFLKDVFDQFSVKEVGYRDFFGNQ